MEKKFTQVQYNELDKILDWLEEQENKAEKDAVENMVGFSISDWSTHYDGKREAFKEVYKKIESILNKSTE